MLVLKRARAFVFSAILIVAGVVLYVPIALAMAIGLGFSKPQPANTFAELTPAAKPLKAMKRPRAV